MGIFRNLSISAEVENSRILVVVASRLLTEPLLPTEEALPDFLIYMEECLLLSEPPLGTSTVDKLTCCCLFFWSVVLITTLGICSLLTELCFEGASKDF